MDVENFAGSPILQYTHCIVVLLVSKLGGVSTAIYYGLPLRVPFQRIYNTIHFYNIPPFFYILSNSILVKNHSVMY